MATKTIKVDSDTYQTALEAFDGVGLDLPGSIDALFAAGAKRLVASQERANKAESEREAAVARLRGQLDPGKRVTLKAQGRRPEKAVTIAHVTKSGKVVVVDDEGVESLESIHKLELPTEE